MNINFIKTSLLLLSVSLVSFSCTNEVDEIVSESAQVKDVELVDGSILKFKDQATFDSYIEKIKSGENVISTITAKSSFKSLETVFDEAMKEAESYYDRAGGYEEFKAKYSSLYFPENGDDYSAYLPVTDEYAKLLNEKGEIIVGEELLTPKQITSYNELIEMGKAPNPNSLRADGVGTNYIGQTINPYNRMIWVNTKVFRNHDGLAVVPTLHVEVCFRKGIMVIGKRRWYNYDSESDMSIYVSGINFSRDAKGGSSSHDYFLPINIYTINNVNYFSPTKGEIKIRHRGIAIELTLYIDYSGGPVLV